MEKKKINFRNDTWMSSSIADMLHIPSQIRKLLQAKVSDFILNQIWSIPGVIELHFPVIASN